MQAQSWLWPDHTITKGESRQLREEHNALVNQNAELLQALKYAAELIPIARGYFPKSIRKSDKFRLENTCATVNAAIAKAEGKL